MVRAELSRTGSAGRIPPEYLEGKKSKISRELDVTVRGKLGSAEVFLIFECRDRTNRQGVGWVEQIASKREDVGADVAVAVSSSGFTSGAEEFAASERIELRRMNEITVGDFFEWYGQRRIIVVEPRNENVHVRVWTDEGILKLQPDFDDFFRPRDERDEEPEELRKQLVPAETGDAVDLATDTDFFPKVFLASGLTPDGPEVPHERLEANGREWFETPVVRQKKLVTLQPELLVDCGDGRFHTVRFIAVAWDYWHEESHVVVSAAHEYAGGSGTLARVATGRFDGRTLEGDVYITRGAGASDGKIVFSLQVKEMKN